MGRCVTNQQNDLCAQRRLGSAWASALFNRVFGKRSMGSSYPNFLYAESEASDQSGHPDQTGRMPRLI